MMMAAAGLLVTQMGDASASVSPLCRSSGISRIAFYNVHSNTNATNATPSWDEAPGGLTTTFYWGNTTSYTFGTYSVVVNKTYSNGSGLYTAPFLNYLEPSSTYYFELYVSIPAGYCPGSWTYTGSWNTKSDSLLYVNGTVYERQGSTNVTAPANVLVWATCGRPDGWDGYAWGYTDTQGAYSIYIGGYGEADPQDLQECWSWDGSFSSHVGLNVTVINRNAYSYDGQPYSPRELLGYFNETIFAWGAQNVNFYLPMNVISPYFPAILDFSNGVGSQSTLQFTQGTSESFTTTFTYSWNIGAGGGGLSGTGSNSTTKSYESGGGCIQIGGTLDYVVQQNESGTVAFSAFTRAWTQTSVNLYGAYLNGNPAGMVPTFVQPADWMTPSNFSADHLYYLTSLLGKVMDNVALSQQGFYYTGYVTTATSQASSGGYTVSYSVTASLPGVGSATAGASAGWSQTSSTTYTNTSEWIVGVPTGGSAICIDVFGQGGSGNYADVMGVYLWPDTGSCT